MGFHKTKNDKPIVRLESGVWYWDPILEIVLFVPKGNRTASTETLWLRRNSELYAIRAILRHMEQMAKEQAASDQDDEPTSG